MPEPTPQEVSDNLNKAKEQWLIKYRSLIIQDESEPQERGPIIPLFGGRDEKLTEAPLGWGEGTMLPGAPRLDGLKTTRAEKFREGEGVIDLIENDEGRRMIAKIDRSAAFGHGADELAVYQHIYETVGPHPNLGRVHGLAVVQHGIAKLPALIMDEVVGDPGDEAMRKLHNAWKRGDIASPEFWGVVQFMGRRLLEVVRHLQDAGIAHNDIKPENFVVDATTGEPVLIDLGLHSVLGDRAPGGTEHFTAPQIMNRGVTTETTDVYSIGRTLQHGLSGLAEGPLETDVVRSLAALAFGRSGSLNPEDGAELDFFADYAIEDTAARRILSRIVSREDPRPTTREITVSTDEAVRLTGGWTRVDQIGNRKDLLGARGRRRLDWLQRAEGLLTRAKEEGVDGNSWAQLRKQVETCLREMDLAAREHQEEPRPVKWTADWKPLNINDYTLDIMATAVQEVIDAATVLLNNEPHVTAIHEALSLHERAAILLRSLRAYINVLTPPILPEQKKLKKIRKKGKTEPPWDALDDMETARLLFTEQFDRLQPLSYELSGRGARIAIILAQAGNGLEPLLAIDWYASVRNANAEFYALNPIVFHSLDEEREQKVREFLQGAQVAWQVIGPHEEAMRQWMRAALEQCRKLGRGFLPDDDLTAKRTELHTRISVINSALTIERDWILRPGGQPAPLPQVGLLRPTTALVQELRGLRAQIEAVSVDTESSLKVRTDSLASLGEDLDHYNSVVQSDPLALKAYKTTYAVWERCVARVKERYEAALTGARKLLTYTTPDHIWRTLNSIQVHLTHQALDQPKARWFQRELEALSLIAVQIERFLVQVGDELEDQEVQQLINILNAMEGYETLEHRFELEARGDKAIPDPTVDRSDLSQQMDAIMNDLQQAASAPWPSIADRKEKIEHRLEAVKGFKATINHLRASVEQANITTDIEQFELLLRVQKGIAQALKDQLG